MDEHYDGHGQYLTLKSIDTRRVTPTIRLEHRVTFTFTIEALFRNFLLEDSTPLPDPFGDERLTDPPATVTVAFGSNPDQPEMRGALERALAPHQLLSEGNRRWLLDRALEEARGILRAQKVRVCVSLEFGVLLEENHYLLAEDFDDLIAEADALWNGSLVPAVDTSITLLKEYKIGCGRAAAAESCCPICLEEFSGRDGEISGRGRLLCMPCDHIFHGECIEKWLKISHYCPLCRYEMPTNY